MSKLKVFTAKRIRTMDAGRPLANAVAVKDGRIVSVGTLETMKRWLEREEREIDTSFQDKVIFPGFIDPHTHLQASGVLMGMTYIGPLDQNGPNGFDEGLASRAAVIEKLRQAVEQDPDSESPVLAWGFDPALHGGQLHRDELDAILSTRPIWTMTYAPHVVVANSPMLELIGVDETTNVYGIEKYDDGRLNGQFIELGATSIALRPVIGFLADAERGAAALRAQAQTAQKVGITLTADMAFGKLGIDYELALHKKVVEDDSFPLRMLLVPLAPGLTAAHGSEAPEYLKSLMAKNTDKLAVHGVKFINDGSYPAQTLRLRYPGYLDGHEGHRGETPWDELVEAMLPYWKAGVQIHSHANGDETVEMTLDLLEQLQLAHPRFDHRFTIEHYCISTPDQARRLKALGGLASVNNMFVHYRALLHADSGFGFDRAEATARLGSLEREGVVFALHSDFSLVLTPISPLAAVWIAVNRIALDEETVLAPGERIGVDRAMRAITIDAAHVIGRDAVHGSVEVGKHADFTVLDEDPYDVDVANIRDIRVHATVLAGRTFETEN
ncbi:amidohydrolase [Pseudophaeobacter arcticus]|uniref:Amidohydrolase n=1 Tax=Pseudophaeobacter arcticus TaxID=385492 RepID=A0ABQ0ARI5_9RHOB